MNEENDKKRRQPGVSDVLFDEYRGNSTGDPACVAEFRDVTFTHSAKRGKEYILKDLSIKLFPGKIAGIASLRSTDFEPVVNLILRTFDYPEYIQETGSIIVNGENTSLLSRSKARPFLKAFNIVAPVYGAGVKRMTVPDEMTVNEYISQKIFLDYYDLEELSKNLKVIGFYDIDALYESKYNMLNLSDRQRLKLAQNLAFKQDIAVIVYPTMSLSGESKYFLQRLMRERLDSGVVKTILLLSEDTEFVGDTADYIVVFDNGNTLAAGTKNEITADSDNEFIQSMLVKI